MPSTIASKDDHLEREKLKPTSWKWFIVKEPPRIETGLEYESFDKLCAMKKMTCLRLTYGIFFEPIG